MMDCDDQLAVHKFCSLLPAFVFEARPVVPVMERRARGTGSHRLRDGLKSRKRKLHERRKESTKDLNVAGVSKDGDTNAA